MNRKLFSFLPIVALMLPFVAFPSSGVRFNAGDGVLPDAVGAPEVFSDRDESASAGTRVRLVRGETPDQRRAAIVEYAVIANEALGYEYAGVSFPFSAGTTLDAEGQIEVELHAGDSELEVEVILRDRSRQRSVRRAILPADEWRTLRFRAPDFGGIDLRQPESLGLAITHPASGRLAIGTMVLPVLASEAAATTQGVRYDPAAAGPFFGAPVPISDRDESPQATSVTTVESRSPQLRLHVNVVPNPELGYEYAGIAVPFPAPLPLDPSASFAFELRSSEPLEGFEVVMRDTSRRRAVYRPSLADSSEWQQIAIPGARFDALDATRIESAAFVLTSPVEAEVELRSIYLPLRVDPTRLSVLQRIQYAPKWHSSAEFAGTVAEIRGVPLVIASVDIPERWDALLLQTINLRVQEDAAAPLLIRDADGNEIERVDDADSEAIEEALGRLRALLSREGPLQEASR